MAWGPAPSWTLVCFEPCSASSRQEHIALQKVRQTRSQGLRRSVVPPSRRRGVSGSRILLRNGAALARTWDSGKAVELRAARVGAVHGRIPAPALFGSAGHRCAGPHAVHLFPERPGLQQSGSNVHGRLGSDPRWRVLADAGRRARDGACKFNFQFREVQVSTREAAPRSCGPHTARTAAPPGAPSRFVHQQRALQSAFPEGWRRQSGSCVAIRAVHARHDAD